MNFPRLPDWLIYTAAVCALVMVSLGNREKADAPPAPPPPGAEEGALLGPATPFDPMIVVDVASAPLQPSSGTAFAISADGEWLTARHVVDGCHKAALVVGGGRAVEASIRMSPRADVALLRTEGGPVALPLAVERPLRTG
ncbi:serine protease, partial [Caulobacter sp. 17J65-9]|uniref:S1 family peptidase n=1 Tax=Caulobacter sp. 17J65-9 TaxID=2709382 RepID=UPI0013C66968